MNSLQGYRNGFINDEVRKGVLQQLRSAESVLGMALARLYLAKPVINVWRFTGVSGALVLVLDRELQLYTFRIYCTSNFKLRFRCAIPVTLTYMSRVAHFHCFHHLEYTVGFSFPIDMPVDKSEGLPTSIVADDFLKVVRRFEPLIKGIEDRGGDAATAAATAAAIAAASKHERKQAKKAAKVLKQSQVSNTNAKKSKSFPKKAFSGMRRMFRPSDKTPSARELNRIRSIKVGPVSNVQHVAHIGLDANGQLDMTRLPEEWRRVFMEAKVTSDDLADPRKLKVIMNTMQEFDSSGVQWNTASRNSAPPQLATSRTSEAAVYRADRRTESLPEPEPSLTPPILPPNKPKSPGHSEPKEKRSYDDGIRVSSKGPEKLTPPPLPPNKPPSPSSCSPHQASVTSSQPRPLGSQNGTPLRPNRNAEGEARSPQAIPGTQTSTFLEHIRGFDHSKLSPTQMKNETSPKMPPSDRTVMNEIAGFDRTKLRSASATRPSASIPARNCEVASLSIAEALRVRLNNVREQISGENSDSETSEEDW